MEINGINKLMIQKFIQKRKKHTYKKAKKNHERQKDHNDVQI